MKNLTEIETLINEQCSQGNLIVLKKLLKSKQNIQSYVVTKGFEQAIYHGQLEVVKYLLTSEHLKTDIHHENDYAIRISCHCGHLELVKFLLTSPLLKEKSNLFVYENEAFRWAAESNHIPIVKFLLTLSVDPHHISSITGNSAFMSACDQNSIESVKYISQLDKFDINVSLCSLNRDYKDGFQLACENHEHDSDIIKYLIMQLGFKPNKRQQQYMIDNMDNEVVAFAYKLLSTKSLHEKLDKQISNKDTKSSKLKI